MKKTALFLAVGLVSLAAVGFALAAGGDAADPLASLSYLTGTFTATVDAQVDARLDESDAALLDGAASGAPEANATVWTETRLKNGDLLMGTTGTNVMLLAGSGTVAFSSGAVVDVTAGTTVSSGAALAANHRYLVAEDTSAVFIVTSKTAVVDYQGPYAFTESGSTDYNAMAAALKTLHLFRGSLTGYGQGFDLEVAPTRLQALIMFIRVLGEEEEALAWTGSMPFTDVPLSAATACYVGYAYEKGYTNGFTATTFQPARTINVQQYVEFVLRAMGHSSTATTDLSDALDRAVACGLLTAGEQFALQSSTFLRADLVYVSYYALSAATADGTTLADTLRSKGVFTAAELREARQSVPGSRMA